MKRYVQEPGTPSLDRAFSQAESQRLQIAFSAWNVGEVLGALDQQHRHGLLTQRQLSSALLNFADETLRMTRQRLVQLTPLAGPILTDSWRILLEEHIYAADALQIASCKHSRCDVFVSADRNLLERARAQGLTGLDPEKDEKRFISLILE